MKRKKKSKKPNVKILTNKIYLYKKTGLNSKQRLELVIKHFIKEIENLKNERGF